MRLGRPPRVSVEVMLGCVQPLFVEAVEVNVEDPGLVVIEPHRRARLCGHL